VGSQRWLPLIGAPSSGTRERLDRSAPQVDDPPVLALVVAAASRFGARKY
jgi:hypothetical protein